MSSVNTGKAIQDEEIPFITRKIDGAVYTVKIRFWPGSKETAKEKIKRLIKNDALYDSFLD